MKVGLVLVIAEHQEAQRPYSYQKTREFAQQAEEAGFDSLWLYDHLLYRHGKRKPVTIGIWESWTFLSALAEATKKVELGTLVACNSFRNPALLVKMAHTLDEVSGGRLILGVGSGWNQPEYEAFGYPFDHRVSRFEEALQIIRPLLKDGWVDFEGKYYKARDCEIRPLGPRPHGPSLLIGCSGKRMMRLTARYADLWNSCYYGPVESFARTRKRMLAACKAEGRDPTSLGITALLTAIYPDLMDNPPNDKQPRLSGNSEEIARGLLGYAEMGVEHVMIHPIPYTPAAMRKLEQALHHYHQLSNEQGHKKPS